MTTTTDMPMRADGTPDFQAFGRKLHEIAYLIETNADLCVNNPEVAAVVQQLDLAVRTLDLELKYWRSVDRLVGGLPRIEQRFGGSPRPTGAFKANAGTFVYVGYDRNDEVIYVGVTDDLFSRMAAHRSSKRWWPHMERLEWEEWPDRAAALWKESILIKRHRPRFNIAGNPDARRAAR